MPVKLDPHQQDALDLLKSGSILCGGVGSGKSIVALAYFFTKECKGGIGHDWELVPPKKPKDLYIITTAKKRDSEEWELECQRFYIFPARELSMGGIRLTVDSWNNIEKYGKVKEAFFIFDEQRVVGSGTWARTFIKIAKKNHWLLLTATPGDTWIDYISVFIANGFYRSRTEFMDKHVVMDPYVKYPKVKRYLDENILEAYRDGITVTLEYNKKTIRHYQVIETSYNTMPYIFATRERKDPDTLKPFRNAAQLCYRLRKICNNDRSRPKALKKLLKRHKNMVIFYNFTYELDELRKFAKSNKLPYAEWNGEKHQPIPETEDWLYLVQYTAGAEGWNCTRTNCTVLYSLNYSYKTMEQACGRIDRRDSKYIDLYYYIFMTNSPIDKAILKCLKNKKNFNEKQFALA